jgi:hypothetical protein
MTPINEGTGHETTTEDDDSLSQYGVGLGYLRGGIGRGFRGEIAYSRVL